MTDLFFSEILNQKQMALQILLIVLSSAVFSNFIRVFEKNQIAEISFYMMYLLVSTMLLRSFSGMDTLVAETLSHITRLIKLLLPAYLASIVFSAGSLSALGFYQAATVTIALLQGVIMRGVLPLLQFYLAVLMLNQMTKEIFFQIRTAFADDRRLVLKNSNRSCGWIADGTVSDRTWGGFL